MNTKDTVIVTRRIQLTVNSSDKALVSDTFTKLYHWRYTCFRATNYIFTHYYLQEQVKDLLYLNEGTRVKLADIKRDADGILTTSKLNTVYQLLSRNFKGNMPMDILTSLNVRLSKYFNNEKTDYLQGTKSLRNYKRDIPIPFRGTDIRRWQRSPDGRNFTFSLFGVPFCTYLGKDFTDKKVLLERVLTGTVHLSGSSIQIKENKIYLLACLEIQKEQHVLDEAVIAEAELTIEYPITVRINKSSYTIGNKEEFLYRRLAIQAARQRLQKAVVYNRHGHGRKRKIQALNRFGEAEKNYVNNRLHLYSRMLINICVKHGGCHTDSGRAGGEGMCSKGRWIFAA
jgi:hypothetical protein